MNRSLAGFTVSAAGIFLILVLLAGFVPEMSNPEIRRPYTLEAVKMETSTTITRPLSHIIWNIRCPFNANVLPQQKNLTNRHSFLEVKNGSITMRMGNGVSPLLSDNSSNFLEPLLKDTSAKQTIKKNKMAEKEALRIAIGEPLDFQGIPLRWIGDKELCDLSPELRQRVDKILSKWRQVSEPSKKLNTLATKYKASVEKYAQRYDLAPDLVYAIIYTESSFDPTLISGRAAHGLMQVVPQTAGEEVHAWLGRSGIPNAESLLHPETNIRYGTAYFHLLLTRHLKGITNPVSREYCAIASYNGGPWRLFKAFGKTNEEALATINSMSPEAIKNFLIHKLPTRETRNFVKKVLSSRERFKTHQNAAFLFHPLGRG